MPVASWLPLDVHLCIIRSGDRFMPREQSGEVLPVRRLP